MKKAKAHQRYISSKGEPCVGVTTVLQVMAKPALIQWSNKLGLDGYDVNKFVDKLANIGSLIHYLIECDCKSIKPDLGDYTQNEIVVAQTALHKWESWKKIHLFKLIDSELQIVSDDLLVGGTCDVYCNVDGKNCVLDIKTSKGIFSEHRTQVVAYKRLLQDNGKPVDECRIVRIGRNETEGFEDCIIGAEELHWKRFLACLELYKANRNLKNVEG